MKIVSLLPSATEICFALGLGDEVVGVTHECDHPAAARRKPVVSVGVFDAARMESASIDAEVRSRLARGESLYAIDRALLAELKPDLILTQNLCDVCAVFPAMVREAIRDLQPQPEVMSLDPVCLDDIIRNMLEVGGKTGREAAAKKYADGLRRRVGRVALRASQALSRPTVFFMEWMEPVFNGGHWIPELIAIAGGEPVLAGAMEKSKSVSWDDLASAAPEVLVVGPCGYDVARTLREIGAVTRRPEWGGLPAVKSGRVWAVDGSAWYARPGPRMVEGLEALAHMVQPELFPAPARDRAVVVNRDGC
jgi:iron complex transport system substrate-binding protein